MILCLMMVMVKMKSVEYFLRNCYIQHFDKIIGIYCGSVYALKL